MAAKPPLREEVAGTMPFSSLVTDSIAIIIALKIGCKIGNSNPFRFFGISFGFLYLPDKTGLHIDPPYISI
jgi:hypothetical protein